LPHNGAAGGFWSSDPFRLQVSTSWELFQGGGNRVSAAENSLLGTIYSFKIYVFLGSIPVEASRVHLFVHLMRPAFNLIHPMKAERFEQAKRTATGKKPCGDEESPAFHTQDAGTEQPKLL
jgi:hypothetical protein